MIKVLIQTVWLIFMPALGKTLIDTTTGPVRGTFIDSFGVKYYSYQGIPYAENPTGDLRFKPPVPKSPWTDELDASHPGHVCPQTDGSYKKDEMSEDCLFVNVFVPANKTDDELHPVLFFIHPGEFMKNSGNSNDFLGPQLLLRYNIIIVTFNYRLGALGFLSLEEEEASGNAGLKDMLLALKWTNDNINRFGGDRNKITIGGNSAGSVATQYLLLSTKSIGLYNQAILISGSALGYRFLARRPKENALALGKELGITFSDSQDLLNKLKAVNVFDIVQAQEDMGKNDTRKGFRPFAPFVPCIEKEYSDAFITEDPRTIFTTGVPNNVPILGGFNSDEGLKMYGAIHKKELADFLNEDFQRCIPSDIGYPYGSEESKELSRSIQNFYFNNVNISDTTMQNFIDLVTDTMFAYSIANALQLHKEREDSDKLYFYVFDFDGQLNYLKLLNKVDYPGTSHADELGYLFVTNTTKAMLCNVDDRSHCMVDVLTKTITNFVKTGNPTPEGNDVGIDWKESGKQLNYLYFNERLENVESRPIPNRLQFWQDVYDQYYQYMENGGKIEYNNVP